MAFYIITYDLKLPGRDYSIVYESIKALGKWQHPLESVWVVYTGFNAQAIYDRLRPNIDNNDHLYINKLDPDDQQGWMVKSFWEWFNSLKEQDVR